MPVLPTIIVSCVLHSWPMMMRAKRAEAAGSIGGAGLGTSRHRSTNRFYFALNTRAKRADAFHRWGLLVPAVYRTTTQYDEHTMLDASTMSTSPSPTPRTPCPTRPRRASPPTATVHKICAARRPEAARSANVATPPPIHLPERCVRLARHDRDRVRRRVHRVQRGRIVDASVPVPTLSASPNGSAPPPFAIANVTTAVTHHNRAR